MQPEQAQVSYVGIMTQAEAQLKHGNGVSLSVAPSLSLPRFFLSARILGPDSQREIQFLLTAPCCPDRIYHLELELLPERQCTVDTS